VPTRIAAACGLLAPLTYCAALLFGGLAQPDAFSSADDAISDLGALTASSPWIYNQIGLNLTGILVMLFALGLWRALSPDLLGRAGAAGLALVGLTLFLQGFLRLDCQNIDAGCENTSWHSDAHGLATGVSAAFLFASPIVLAFAFRRLANWRNAWLPTLAAIPAFLLTSVLFSVLGNGASTRAGAITWFLWLAFIAFQLLNKGYDEQSRARTKH
jgi:hypothetical membrane protein